MTDKENTALYGFRKYGDTVLRAAYACTGSMEEAEDITQDTFITAVQHIGELRDPSKVRTWLYRIMTNLTHRKYARGVRETASDEVTELADADAFIGYMIDKTLSESDREAMLEEDFLDMSVNDQGIMMGDGQLWLGDPNYGTDAEPVLEIIAINGIVER